MLQNGARHSIYLLVLFDKIKAPILIRVNIVGAIRLIDIDISNAVDRFNRHHCTQLR